MNVTFKPKNNCLEYKYWSKAEVIRLVAFLLNEDKFIFLKAGEIIANFNTKLSISDILIQIFPFLTTIQAVQYREKLEVLSNLLASLHGIAKDENELGILRTAVIEKFIYQFVSNKYSTNHSHHCIIKIGEQFIDRAKDVDVAGWESDAGEFHECKAGDFDYVVK
ncbi:hypothetical protein KJ980_05135 [Patescibacteria group bacterium]|nr:hypothetical protein [Patescibacteria group bacterium]MBU4016723.1 hypothetical protein [Patescibacteria group bacterium]MBU4099004.1 hypothetical protein [Patescibacteria group bacterium]